jgi:hypothetical protein
MSAILTVLGRVSGLSPLQLGHVTVNITSIIGLVSASLPSGSIDHTTQTTLTVVCVVATWIAHHASSLSS